MVVLRLLDLENNNTYTQQTNIFHDGIVVKFSYFSPSWQRSDWINL